MLKRIIQNFRSAWTFPRWRFALLVALISDALSFGVVLLPPVQWVVDAVTAVVLFAVLGFRWSLLSAPGHRIGADARTIPRLDAGGFRTCQHGEAEAAN